MGNIACSGRLDIPYKQLPFPVPWGWFKFDGSVTGTVTYRVERPSGLQGQWVDVAIDPTELGVAASYKISEDLAFSLSTKFRSALPSAESDPSLAPALPGLVARLSGSNSLGLTWSVSTDTSDWMRLFFLSGSGSVPVVLEFPFEEYRVRISGGPEVTAKVGLMPTGARAIGGRIAQWARSTGGVATRLGRGALTALETTAAATFVAAVSIGGTYGALKLMVYWRECLRTEAWHENLRRYYAQGYVHTLFRPEQTMDEWSSQLSHPDHRRFIGVVRSGSRAALQDVRTLGRDVLLAQLGRQVRAFHGRSFDQLRSDTAVTVFLLARHLEHQ